MANPPTPTTVTPRRLGPAGPASNRSRVSSAFVSNLSTWTGRDAFPTTFAPAILVSAILHLVLLLILSLIVIGSGGVNAVLEISMDQSANAPVEIATFDLEPLDTPEVAEDTLNELDVELAIDINIPAPELSVDEEIENESQATTTELPVGGTSPASTTLAQPLSRAAMSIQQRVSEAGGQRGEIQFALAWKNTNDVDLHVIAPSGERVCHIRRGSRCGGLLDVDMNVRGESEQPVENVRWLRNAPAGRYTVVVNLFRIHRPKSGSRVYRGSEFQLLAQLGDESSLESDIVNSRNQVAVYRFIYVPSSLNATARGLALAEIRKLQEQEDTAAGKLLESAEEVKKTQLRDRLLNNLIALYPHTDAAIEAMQLLGGSITKAGF